jgi:hypothetical protein
MSRRWQPGMHLRRVVFGLSARSKPLLGAQACAACRPFSTERSRLLSAPHDRSERSSPCRSRRRAVL